MYKLLRPLLFCLPTECAHALTLNLLKLAHSFKLTHFFSATSLQKPITILGLSFKNRIGIAAGLDKNGDYIDSLAALGVGFIEVGAVTPKPQIGNAKPRLFRLVKQEALINRMGFNNKGVDYVVRNLKRRKSSCIVGVNLGKNKETPLEHAADDYIYCLEKIFLYSDFATINISSPNTPDLRQLQTPKYLKILLSAIKKIRDDLVAQHSKSMPLFVKISPDLTNEELMDLLDIITEVGMDGVIATNTTITEKGGLSGKPVANRSYEMLGQIRQYTRQLPVISVGGISSVAEAQQRLAAGADLVQLYTGLIYEGPSLLRRLISAK
jgi:dihydroorotate dehydrogenase